MRSAVGNYGQNLTIMSEHERAILFLRHLIRYDGKDDRRQLEKYIPQVQRHGRFVTGVASVMALLAVLAILGVGAMVAFAGLLMGHRERLKRLRDDRQFATRHLEPHLSKPDAATLPGSYRGSDDREAFQGAAEARVYHGSPDSPSWLSNRICG